MPRTILMQGDSLTILGEIDLLDDDFDAVNDNLIDGHKHDQLQDE